MAQNLSSITRVSPSADPNIDVGQSFTFEISKAFSGGGGVNEHDTRVEYSTNDVDWNVITGATPLSTASANPQLNQADTANDTWTIDGDTAGTYYIRAQADRNGGNNSYDIPTASQIVTVNATGGTTYPVTLQDLDSAAAIDSATVLRQAIREALDASAATDSSISLREVNRVNADDAVVNEPGVDAQRTSTILSFQAFQLTDDKTATYVEAPTYVVNTVTLQDLNSISAIDNSPPERERSREELETIDLADFTEEERERIRELLDEADLSYAAESRHKRTITILDSWIGITDAIDTSEPEGPIYLTKTDTLTVLDALFSERQNIRELIETLQAIDAAIMLRSIDRFTSDNVSVTDSLSTTSSNSKFIIDAADLTDDEFALRERNRLLLDALEVAESITIRHEVNRSLFDSIILTDGVDAIYVPVGSATIERELTDLIALVDTLTLLRSSYRTLLDTLIATDQVFADQTGLKTRILTDSFDVREPGVDAARIHRVVSWQTFTLGDSVDATQPAEGAITSRTLTDTADVTDIDEELRDRIRAASDDLIVHDYETPKFRDQFLILTESLEVLDSLIAVSASVLSRTVQETVAAIDTATELRQRFRLRADGFDLSDSVKRAIEQARETTDIFDVTDTDSALRYRYRTLVDSLETLDAVVVEQEGILRRTLSDALVAADAVVILQLLTRLQTDYAALDDTQVPERLRERLLADEFGITDSITWNQFQGLLISDSFSLADFLTGILERGRVSTDTVTLTDEFTATYLPEGILTYYKTLLDSFGMSDAVVGNYVYPLIDFIIRHSIQRINIDHDIERFHIRHKVERIT